MTLHLCEGPWHLAVATEHDAASFRPVGTLADIEVVPQASSTGINVRAVVELKAVTGGLRPRALLGGGFDGKSGTQISFESIMSETWAWVRLLVVRA